MAALKPEQVKEVVRLYDGGKGEKVSALADAYKVTEAAVKYHLKKSGVYQMDTKQLSESPTDKELGIGDDDEPPQSAEAELEAILENPALAALIDRAVASRLAQMGGAAPAPRPESELREIVRSFERIVEAQAQQTPGYVKPLSTEEFEARAAAKVEMLALIEDARRRNDRPHYILGPQGMFDSTNVMHYPEGTEIKSFLQPVEDAIPVNDIARKIHAAFIRSIGGPTPEIGAQIAEAMLTSKGKDVPLVGAAPAAAPSAVEVVATPQRHQVGPKRVLGTLTPETHGRSMPVQPGVTAQPVGPVFVDGAAA